MNTDKHELTIVYPELKYVVKYSYVYNIPMNAVTTINFVIYAIDKINEETEEVVCKEVPITQGDIITTGSILFRSYSLCFRGTNHVRLFSQLLEEIYDKATEIFKIEFKEED